MAQSTKTIESVWAAKGNLPDNAIVSTADGKYPALDGSLITNISKTATFALEPKRSTAVTFADLGFVAEMSENAGNNGFNGFAFDATTTDPHVVRSGRVTSGFGEQPPLKIRWGADGGSGFLLLGPRTQGAAQLI